MDAQFIGTQLSDLQNAVRELTEEVSASRTELCTFRTELLGGLQPGRLQRIEKEHETFWRDITSLKQSASLASGAWFAIERIVNWAVTFAALAFAYARYKAGGGQ